MHHAWRESKELPPVNGWTYLETKLVMQFYQVWTCENCGYTTLSKPSTSFVSARRTFIPVTNEDVDTLPYCDEMVVRSIHGS